MIAVTVTGAPLKAFAVFDVIDTQSSEAPPPNLAPAGLCGAGLGQIMIVTLGAWLMLGFTRRP